MIAPSVLSANFSDLRKDIEMINRSEAALFHLDIMDGLFVPNISYGFPVVKAIAQDARKPLDAHLMIVDPDRYVSRFKELGVEYLSVHIEACTHLHRSVINIKDQGMKAGVALNPHTSITLLDEILEYCDYILIMSVNPGYGGQSFIKSSLSKIERLKNTIMSRGLSTLIEVDGGVSLDNCGSLYSAGADILVAGNTVFSADDPAEMIKKLKNKRIG